MKINFSKDQYAAFMAILNQLKFSCCDVSIVNGKIFQENTKKNILYDIDLTPIVGEETIYIDELNTKHTLLSIFSSQDCKVKLEILDKKYKYYDNDSKLEFPIPLVSNLRLKTISKDSNKAELLTESLGDNIFTVNLSSIILDRIKFSVKPLDTDTVTLALKEDIAEFCILMNGNNAAIVNKFYCVNDLNVDTYNGIVKYPVEPFLINSDYLNISLYSSTKDKEKLTMKFETKIKDIDVKIWSTMPYKEKTNKG